MREKTVPVFLPSLQWGEEIVESSILFGVGRGCNGRHISLCHNIGEKKIVDLL